MLVYCSSSAVIPLKSYSPELMVSILYEDRFKNAEVRKCTIGMLVYSINMFMYVYAFSLLCCIWPWICLSMYASLFYITLYEHDPMGAYSPCTCRKILLSNSQHATRSPVSTRWWWVRGLDVAAALAPRLWILSAGPAS